MDLYYYQLLSDNNTLFEGASDFGGKVTDFNIYYLNNESNFKNFGFIGYFPISVIDFRFINNINVYHLTSSNLSEDDYYYDFSLYTGFCFYYRNDGYYNYETLSSQLTLQDISPNVLYNNSNAALYFHSSLNYAYYITNNSYYLDFCISSFNFETTGGVNRLVATQILQYTLISHYGDALDLFYGISLFKKLKDDLFIMLGADFADSNNPFFRILHINNNSNIDFDTNIANINQGTDNSMCSMSCISEVNDYQNDPVWIIFGISDYSSTITMQTAIKYFPNGLYDSNYNLKKFETNPSGCEALFQVSEDFPTGASYVWINKNFTKVILSTSYSQNYEFFYKFKYYQKSLNGSWYKVTNEDYIYNNDIFLKNLLKEEHLTNSFIPNRTEFSHTFTYIQNNMLYAYDLVWND